MGRHGRQPDETAIEFLPVDVRAFGPGHADETVFAGFDGDDDPFDGLDDEAPHSRWLVVVAGLVVAGLLAVGVVAAAPWDDDATAPSTTLPPATSVLTTSAPTTTVGAAPPAEPTADAPGIVFDPVPEGLALRDSRVGVAAADLTYGWGEVWTTPGATRTTDRWFSVTLHPFAGIDDAGSAVDVGGRAGRLVVDRTGVSRLSFDAGQTDALRLVTVAAFGFDEDQLVELGASIGIDDDRPQLVDDRPVFLRPELLDGLARIAAAPSADDLVDQVLQPPDRTAGTVYAGGVDPETLVLLQVSPIHTEQAVLAPLALDERLAIAPPDGFEGEGLTVGRRAYADADLSAAWWDVSGQRITVLSTLAPEALVALLPNVRLASDVGPWILEPGADGYIAVSAADPEPLRAEHQPTGRFRLWAAPGASRTDGIWVAVHQLPWEVGGSTAGRRIAIREGTGVIDDGDDGVGGVSTLTWSPDDASTIVVTAHGLTTAQVVTLAEQQADGDPPPFEGIADGVPLLIDRPTENARLDDELFTRSRWISTFTRPSDHSTVVVESAPPDPDEEVLVRILLPDGRGTLEVFGSRTSVVTHSDGATRLIVHAELPVDVLEPLAAGLARRATPDEWRALVVGPPNYVNAPAVAEARPQEVAGGVTQAGRRWRMLVDIGRRTVTLDDDGAEERFVTDDLLADRAITLRSTTATTFVVVRVPPATGAVAARVRAGSSSRVIALHEVAGDDRLYGALAFSEDGDVTVDLLDARGREVDDAA